jgi:uncharacterized protein with PQ loop repeat
MMNDIFFEAVVIACGFINGLGFLKFIRKIHRNKSSDGINIIFQWLTGTTALLLTCANMFVARIGITTAFFTTWILSLFTITTVLKYRSPREISLNKRHYYCHALLFLCAIAVFTVQRTTNDVGLHDLMTLAVIPLGMLACGTSVLRNVPQILTTIRTRETANLSSSYFLINTIATSTVLAVEISHPEASIFNILNCSLSITGLKPPALAGEL